MDYGEIIGTAFKLAWRHKSLWVLGFFAAGASNFGFNLPDEWGEKIEGPREIGCFFEDHPEMIIALLALALLLFLTFLILNIICTAGLIDAVNRLTRGGVYRLRESFSYGAKFFWSILGLYIISAVFAVGGLAVIAVPVVVMFLASTVLGILSLVVAVPLLFFMIFFIVNMFTLAERAVVVRRCGIQAAIEEGFHLVRRHLLPNIIFFLIYIGLSLVITIVVLIVFIIMAVPLFILAQTSTPAMIISIMVGLMIFLVVGIPVGGFLGTAFQAMYTLFYFRLVEPAPPAAYQPAQMGP